MSARPFFAGLGRSLPAWLACLALAAAVCPVSAADPEMPAPRAPDPAPARLTLFEAVGLALEGNLDLRVERRGPMEAMATQQQARGDFDPVWETRLGTDYRERLVNQYDAESRRLFSSLESAALVDTLDPETGLVGELDPEQQSLLEESIRSADLRVREFEEETRSFRTQLSQLLPFGAEIDLVATEIQSETSLTRELSSTGLPLSPFYPDQHEALLYARITQPLLRGAGFGANLVGIRVTRANKKQADAQFVAAVQRSVAAVVRAYYDYAYARNAVEVLQASRDAARLLLDQTRTRFEQGTIDMVEVRRTESELAEREDGLLAGQNQAVELRNALLRLLFNRPDYMGAGEVVPVDGVPDPERMPDPDFEGLALKARELRPEYATLQAEAEAEQARLRYARNQLLPEVNLVAGYGLRGLDESTRAVADRVFEDQDRHEWSVAVVASVPIGNREARGLVGRARARVQEVEDRRLRLDAQVHMEIANALDSCRSTAERIRTAAVSRRAADATVAAETLRLQEGQTTVFVVVQAQKDQRIAQLRQLLAELDHAKSRVALELACGSILDRFGIVVEGSGAPDRGPSMRMQKTGATRPDPSKS